MFCSLCNSSHHTFETHTLSLSRSSLIPSKASKERKWNDILSWPVRESQISSADWQQLEKVSYRSNVDCLQVNDDILVRMQDGVPFEFIDFIDIPKPQTVLELLCVSSGLSSFSLNRIATASLKQTFWWHIHDSACIYQGKMILGVIFPKHNPLQCDRFLWSPLFPESFLWYHVDTILPKSSIVVTVHTDELFSIAKHENGSYVSLIRSYDGLELNIFNREHNWFHPAFAYLLALYGPWYLCIWNHYEEEEEEEVDGEICTFDLLSMVDKQKYQKDHLPITTRVMKKDPFLDVSDQHQVSWLVHLGQEFYFRHRFSNNQHISFFDAGGQLKKAWHFAKLIQGPLPCRILLDRVHPPHLNLQEDQTFQPRPDRNTWAGAVAQNVGEHLEAWEFNDDFQWICKWRKNIEFDLHSITWINTNICAGIRGYCSIDIFDFTNGNCIDSIPFQRHFLHSIKMMKKTANNYLTSTLHLHIHTQLAHLLLPTLSFIVITYLC